MGEGEAKGERRVIEGREWSKRMEDQARDRWGTSAERDGIGIRTEVDPEYSGG